MVVLVAVVVTMVATEILVSEVVTGTMVTPELWGGENDVKMPAPFGVKPSWAMPWFSYCRQEDRLAHPPPPPPPLPPALDLLPTPHGPSRYLR